MTWKVVLRSVGIEALFETTYGNMLNTTKSAPMAQNSTGQPFQGSPSLRYSSSSLISLNSSSIIHLNFNVANPSSAKITDNTQNRVVTLVSDQPRSSK